MYGEALRALRELPQVRLANLPTPLERAGHLSRLLNRELWIKRDDLTGLGLGGNKVRKLEFIVGDAMKEEAGVLITSAAAQSNFCRLTAAAARKCGMEAALLLRGSPEAPIQGNLLLNYMLGAHVEFTTTSDPFDPDTKHRLDAMTQHYLQRGLRPYLVYLHEGRRPGALAVLGYVVGYFELVTQLAAEGIEADRIYVACGSGGTLAGLMLGVRLAGKATRVTGVSVNVSANALRARVVQAFRAAADLIGADVALDESEVALEDAYVGPGYAIATPEALEAIELSAREEALLLNPVYTGKAMAALIGHIRAGIIDENERVVFLNTGGDPLIFQHAAVIAGYLSRKGYE